MYWITAYGPLSVVAIADALGWTVDRVRASAHELARIYAGLGRRLQIDPDANRDLLVTLRADILSTDTRIQLTAAAAAGTPLTAATAAALVNLVRDHILERDDDVLAADNTPFNSSPHSPMSLTSDTASWVTAGVAVAHPNSSRFELPGYHLRAHPDVLFALNITSRAEPVHVTQLDRTI
ncbi:MAG TPA: hypothetical protein VHX38_08610 [Pseudonocardiaceae bacterium]|nr:hypothetical protein [Pseudonocardiaceae bacterium]